MTRLARVSFVQNPATIKCNMHGAGWEGNQGPLCVCHLHRTPVVSCLGPVTPDLCLPAMPCSEPGTGMGLQQEINGCLLNWKEKLDEVGLPITLTVYDLSNLVPKEWKEQPWPKWAGSSLSIILYSGEGGRLLKNN